MQSPIATATTTNLATEKPRDILSQDSSESDAAPHNPSFSELRGYFAGRSAPLSVEDIDTAIAAGAVEGAGSTQEDAPPEIDKRLRFAWEMNPQILGYMLESGRARILRNGQVMPLNPYADPNDPGPTPSCPHLAALKGCVPHRGAPVSVEQMNIAIGDAICESVLA